MERKAAYLATNLLQEAGDSLMMNLGEAANRLSRLDVLAPEGVDWALAVANRNFIIHQYDEINRELTWLTLSQDLAKWKGSLESLFDAAEAAVSEHPRMTAPSPVARRYDDRVRVGDPAHRPWSGGDWPRSSKNARSRTFEGVAPEGKGFESPEFHSNSVGQAVKGHPFLARSSDGASECHSCDGFPGQPAPHLTYRSTGAAVNPARGADADWLCSPAMTNLTAMTAAHALDRLVDWQTALRADNEASGTVALYADGASHYLIWCTEHDLLPMSRAALNQWVAGLLDAGVTPGTARIRQLAVGRSRAIRNDTSLCPVAQAGIPFQFTYSPSGVASIDWMVAAADEGCLVAEQECHRVRDFGGVRQPVEGVLAFECMQGLLRERALDHRGTHESGPYRIDADTLGSILPGCALRESDDCVLGRHIGSELCETNRSDDRCDVDDRAAAA
jgi:uncharacterized protein with HEPN domain